MVKLTFSIKLIPKVNLKKLLEPQEKNSGLNVKNKINKKNYYG
jgi:hypothetical protein